MATGYREIADHIRGQIADGALAPGDRLATERAMAVEYSVSRNTVKAAIQLLRSEGLVVAEQGRGTFVQAKPPIRRRARMRFRRSRRDRDGKAAFLAEAEDEGRKPKVKVRRLGTPDRAPVWVAERLDLDAGAEVLVRDRLYFTDGVPVETAVTYIPWSIAEGTQMAEMNTGPGGVYRRLEEAGHRLERFTEDVSARMPTPGEAATLDLEPGVPVLIVVRVAYDTTGRPVEICDTTMAANRWALGYEWDA